MGNARLRDLSHAYANGQLEQPDYRAQRAALLDEIANGAAVEDDPFSPATRPMQQVRTPPPAPAPAARKGRSKAVVWLALLVVLLAGGLLFTTTPWQTPDYPAPSATVADAMLFSAFLQQDRWTRADLASITALWQQLSAEQQKLARHAPVFQQLADQWRRRLASQRALADAASNSDKAHQRELQLQRFGDNLGLNE